MSSTGKGVEEKPAAAGAAGESEIPKALTSPAEPKNEDKQGRQKTSASKFDASLLPESNDPAAILKQVEFYLGDANLPRDKFLWELTQKNHGWVPIRTIATFKRMARFKSLEAIAEALRTSKLLEVDENGKSVRRRIPLAKRGPEATRPVERSIYAKGFGEETPTLQVDLEAFFAAVGATNQVRLRRKENGEFKGSVFVEFSDIAATQKFLQDNSLWKWQDQEIEVMAKKAYLEMKGEEHADESQKDRPRPFNAFREMKKRGGRHSTADRGRRQGRGDQKGERKRPQDDQSEETDDVKRLKGQENGHDEAVKEKEMEMEREAPVQQVEATPDGTHQE